MGKPLDSDAVRVRAERLRETLAAIDAGDVEASALERAYVAGAAETLDALLTEAGD